MGRLPRDAGAAFRIACVARIKTVNLSNSVVTVANVNVI